MPGTGGTGPGTTALEKASYNTKYSTEPLKKNPAQVLTLCNFIAYHVHVAAKSATRFDDRKRKRRTSAPDNEAGAFFCACSPALWRLCMGGFEPAGSFFPGSSTYVPAATHCLTTMTAVPKPEKGTPTMKSPLVALHTARSDAHRAMARHALHADSSLSVRRNRYNHHMTKARAALACAHQCAVLPETISQENRHA
jgi:hypothetical protein